VYKCDLRLDIKKVGCEVNFPFYSCYIWSLLWTFLLQQILPMPEAEAISYLQFTAFALGKGLVSQGISLQRVHGDNAYLQA